MVTKIIVGVISFIFGELSGIFCMAVLVGGKLNRLEYLENKYEEGENDDE